MTLKDARKRAGLTQKALAAQVRVSPSTVSLWETGSCMPRPDKLSALEKVLGLAKGELFSQEPSRALVPPPQPLPASGPLKTLETACDIISYVHLCLRQYPENLFNDLCDRLAYAHGCLCHLKILPVKRKEVK